MKLPLLRVLAGLCALPAAAQDNRWMTFKTIRDKWGKSEYQIDRTTGRGLSHLLDLAAPAQAAIVLQQQLPALHDLAEICGGLRPSPFRRPLHRQHRSDGKKAQCRSQDGEMDRAEKESGGGAGRMRGKMRYALMLLLAMTVHAQAQDAALPAPVPETAKTAATGNLPSGFYPKSPCIKPDAQSIGRKPGDRRDGRAVAAFNDKVRAYNKTAEAYNACVQDYAARAQHDIQEIRAAIAAAN
jgi:hypothetical protein